MRGSDAKSGENGTAIEESGSFFVGTTSRIPSAYAFRGPRSSIVKTTPAKRPISSNPALAGRPRCGVVRARPTRSATNVVLIHPRSRCRRQKPFRALALGGADRLGPRQIQEVEVFRIGNRPKDLRLRPTPNHDRNRKQFEWNETYSSSAAVRASAWKS